MRVRIALLLGILCALVSGCSQDNSAVGGGSTYETENPLIAYVVDSAGNPQMGDTVRIRPYWYIAGIGLSVRDSILVTRDLRTDASGFFIAEGLPEGEYRIEIRGKGRGLLVGRSLEGGSTMARAPRYVVQTYGTVRGRVDLPSGSARAVVQVYGTEHRTVTDAQGHFVLHGMPAGEIRIRSVDADSMSVVGEASALVRASEALNVGTLSVESEDPRTWRYAREVVLNTTTSGVHTTKEAYDVPLLLRLDTTRFPVGSRNGDDLRVLDASGRILSTELQRWDETSRSAWLWVSLDTLRANDSTQRLRVLYGNPGARRRHAPEAVWDTAGGWSGVWHMTNTYSDLLKRSRIRDETVHRQHALLGGTNAFASVAGVFPGHYFDGVTDRMRIGGLGVELGARDFTFEVWVNTTRAGATILHKGDLIAPACGKQFFLGAAASSDRTPGWMPFFDAAQSGRLGSGATIRPGAWTHLAFRWSSVGVDSAQGTWFVNGVRSDVTRRLPKIIDNAGDSIGVGDIFAGQPDSLRFSGTMGELRISHVARSDEWLLLALEATRPGNRLISFR